MHPISDLTPKHFFFDLEVDSVPRQQGEPLQCIRQIAVCDPSRPKGERYFVAHVKPNKFLRRHEFYANYNPQDQHVKPHKWKKVFGDLTRWVNSSLDGNRKAVFIAHNNYKHDWPILERECARVQEAVPKYWSPFCTAYLAGTLYGRGGNTLSQLCHKLGVPRLPAHDAYNDVKMLKKVFNKMIGEASLKKVVQLMLTPPRQGPVKKVAALIQKNLIPNIVVYDFEGTGLPKEGQPNPRVVEIGAYFPSRGEEWQTFVNPGIKIPEESIAIHHITDDMVREAPGFKAAWLKFEEKLDDETAQTANKINILMGHNIWGYDNKVYKMECERTNLPVRNFKSFDTYALCSSLFKGLPRISQKLQTWVERFQIPIAEGEAHRAGADSRVNYEVFQRFVEGVPQEMINKSLMSAHPVKSLACAILEHGVFSPSFWSPKKEDDHLQIKRKAEYAPKGKEEEIEPADFTPYAPAKKRKVKIDDHFSRVEVGYNPQKSIQEEEVKQTFVIMDDEGEFLAPTAPPRKAFKRSLEAPSTPPVEEVKRAKPEEPSDELTLFFGPKK